MTEYNRLAATKRARKFPKSTGTLSSKSRYPNMLRDWVEKHKPDFLIPGRSLPSNVKSLLFAHGISPKLYTRILFNDAMMTLDEFRDLCKIIGADPKDLL
jgi:hypothetical protein